MQQGGLFPYHFDEDGAAAGAQLRVFRTAVWFSVGSAGIVLLLLQAFILQWSLRPISHVINELAKVQRGQAQRMSNIRLSWNHSPRVSTRLLRASVKSDQVLFSQRQKVVLTLAIRVFLMLRYKFLLARTAPNNSHARSQ